MKIALLPGDGIGPEISDSIVDIFDALHISTEWIKVPCGETALKEGGSALPEKSIQTIKEIGIGLKGPTATPSAGGHRSANVSLRKELDLYANIRPIFNLPGVPSPFKNIDLIIVRENTEDVYMGIEHRISADIAQCLKTITRSGCERVIRFAFELARKKKRKKVTAVHKANIMKLTDGLFLEVFRSIASQYGDIESNDLLVDNTCLQLVRRPETFDVIVTENLYGDILSDLCAGLVGGLGVAGGANIGDRYAIFEAVHGTAPDIAGKGLANPTALLLSSMMMLEYLQQTKAATVLKNSLFEIFESKKSLTKDLGGSATTKEFTRALVENIKKGSH